MYIGGGLLQITTHILSVLPHTPRLSHEVFWSQVSPRTPACCGEHHRTGSYVSAKRLPCCEVTGESTTSGLSFDVCLTIFLDVFFESDFALFFSLVFCLFFFFPFSAAQQEDGGVGIKITPTQCEPQKCKSAVAEIARGKARHRAQRPLRCLAPRLRLDYDSRASHRERISS